MTVVFTSEQRAAIDDRAGSALLAANAGSGKTAVMAERCVEAVLRDGVPVGSILALTFTEKAAGELRERIRRRFLALGEEEHAREVDAGWIGTIHGFCARVLRSRPLAAGLDPRFEVLDEGAAERLARDAYERAFEAWAAARGPAAIDVAAAFGPGLRDIVLDAHSTLRSRGETRPVLPVPPPAPDPDPAALAAARAEAARCLATAGNGRRLEEALDALETCERALGMPGVPVPAALAPGELKKGSKALEQEPCAAYRGAWATYRQGCADHHARLALVEIADLLDRFGATYADAKAARAGLDFDDLELGVRDLLAAPASAGGLVTADARARRERWAARFELIMVDEFQDTNRLQLDVLEALERDNLFAVGDEFQSIYGFRHADVTIFRERRAALGEGRVRPLTANFRSREELLDVLNAAFAPQWPERFAPLLAGAASNGTGELRLFDPGEPGDTEPRVELLVTDARGWEEDERLGLTGVEAKPHRRAEARVIAHRLRARARRRPGRARRRRARSGDRVAEVVRGGARGAGRADLRRRRPRILVPAAGPRRPRLPGRAGQPARRGGPPRRARLALLRRGVRRADPPRRRREGARRAVGGPAGRAARGGLPGRRRRAARRVRTLLRRRARARRAPARRGAARARARGAPATTSPCSRAPAASGGSRTCAS